jgi:hypothetical protein
MAQIAPKRGTMRDALRSAGLEDVDMPVTGERIWRALGRPGG